MKFFKSNYFKVILVVLFLLIIFFIVSIVTGKNIFVNYISGLITTPVQSVTENVSNSSMNLWNKFNKYDQINEENENLKKEISDLESEINRSENLIEENKRLKELLDYKNSVPNLSLKTAAIISKSSNEWYDSFTINIGSLNGVNKGNAVITDLGFVGVINEVSLNHSTVSTILNPECVIGAFDIRINEPSILEGNLELSRENFSKLTFFDNKSDIAINDTIVTSGLGKDCPANIKLGTVTEILTDTNGLSKFAKITPAVQLDKLKKVFVVVDFEGKMQ
ncbi:MAG: rod shape-determining protein MreC [Clostridia bacterium]